MARAPAPVAACAALLLAAPGAALAQTADATEATRPLEATAAQPPAPAPPPSGAVLTAGRANLTLSGYAEALWQWNFNDPANGVTNYRAFDSRHNAFTLSNVVLDAAWQYRRVQGRVALQVGQTPEQYYGAEPSRPAEGTAGPTGRDVWRFIQQANVGYRAPVGGASLLVEAGIFLSPVGPETMSVRENWNWSRSNLFFGLPYYHTGLRGTYSSANGRHALAAGVFNGWNSVVDNNDGKSVMLQYTYTPASDAALNLLYFGGPERAAGDPAGPAWRHMLDAYARLRASRALSVMGHVNAGFESNRFGVHSWTAFAAYGRFDLTRLLHATLRIDFFQESAPAGSPRIFWPADWVSSQTVTVDLTPFDHALFRFEYRHDVAEGAMYFRDREGASGPGAQTPTSRSQDTFTAGMVAWF